MDEKQDLLEETRALRTNLDTTNNKHTIEMKNMQEKLKAASLKNKTLELEKNQFSGITFGNGKVKMLVRVNQELIPKVLDEDRSDQRKGR